MSSGSHSMSPALERYYKEMSRVRNGLVLPLSAIISIFFFGLLFLTNFTSILDGVAFSGVTWAYLWAFATFFLVVILTMFYKSRMDAAERSLAAELGQDVR